jgi:uncharacterized linocin/CFP29 family protein
MADDCSPLHWTPQQWASLRAAAQEAARKSRVASTFLPLAGPVARDQTTVPSQWMKNVDVRYRQRGEPEQRLEVRSGKTLQLVTISSPVYLRGADVQDPDLQVAKSMVRRAAEVLGRVEDAIVFNGLNPGPTLVNPVQPAIFTVSGGEDLTGLLEAPDTLWQSRHAVHARASRSNAAGGGPQPDQAVTDINTALVAVANADPNNPQAQVTQQQTQGGTSKQSFDSAVAHLNSVAKAHPDVMCVSLTGKDIVTAVVNAVQRLETKGQFGPFALVLGHDLFTLATDPSGSLVLPSDRFVPFLQGGPLHRSSTIPPGEGVVVALAGDPVELVLGCDMDVQFLQVTVEPRYVLRVYERFVLRIKELDAVCKITTGPCLKHGFTPRAAGA